MTEAHELLQRAKLEGHGKVHLGGTARCPRTPCLSQRV